MWTKKEPKTYYMVCGRHSLYYGAEFYIIGIYTDEYKAKKALKRNHGVSIETIHMDKDEKVYVGEYLE